MQFQALEKSIKDNNTNTNTNTNNKKVLPAKDSLGHRPTIDVKSTVTVNPLKSSLIVLYLLSLVSFVSHKIPFLSKFIPILKKMAGKTPFWTLLILSRKVFVLFNALLAMYFVSKLAGWDQGSFLGAFVGMGTVYVEIFTNFIKTSFNWFLELFDMKIVPQVPKDKPNFPFSPSSGYGWFTKPAVENNYLDIAEKAKSWYSSPTNIDGNSIPWYRDWSWTSLLYVAGGIILVIGGLMIYNHIDIMNNGSPVKDATPQAPPAPQAPGVPQVNIEPATPPQEPSTGMSGLVSTVLGIPRYLNPMKLIPSYMTQDQLAYHQNSNASRLTVYPFNRVDPTQPWYTRLRLAYLWETGLEESYRNSLIKMPRAGGSPMFTHGYLSKMGLEGSTLNDRPATTTTALGIHSPVATPGWKTVALSPHAPTHLPLPGVAPLGELDIKNLPGNADNWVNPNPEVVGQGSGSSSSSASSSASGSTSSSASHIPKIPEIVKTPKFKLPTPDWNRIPIELPDSVKNKEAMRGIFNSNFRREMAYDPVFHSSIRFLVNCYLDDYSVPGPRLSYDTRTSSGFGTSLLESNYMSPTTPNDDFFEYNITGSKFFPEFFSS